MKQSSTKRSTNILVSIFLILTLLLSLGGNLLYRYQKKNITLDKYNELLAISKLKVDQLVKWRKDHMDEARSISKSHAIKVHINEYILGIDHNKNYPALKEWIYSLLDNPEYTLASLIDPDGKNIIDTNPADPISEEGYRIIKEATSGKEIIFSDIFRYNHNKICMDIAIPLFLDLEQKKGFLGVVFLRIDPDIFLYSNILQWPIPVKSSEVLIARRDGDSVLYLSELQHKENSAVQLRKPLSNKNLLIVQALNGKTGVLEGIDYRGIKVMGDVFPVPGSPWYVITKVDSDEIFNPIIALATWLFIITFLLILISALIIYFVWKRQNEEIRIIRQQYLQELVDEQTIDLKELNLQLQNDIAERKQVEVQLRESEQRLSFHFENSPLAVVEWDAGYIVSQWSKEAEHIFGWKATETLGKPIADLNMIYIDDIQIVNLTMERLSSGKEDVVVSSNRNYTKTGEVIETIWYNTILNDETGKMASVMSLVEDVTERKKTESELRKLSQAVEQSPVSIVITDLDGVIEYGNPRVFDITGYTAVELLGKKPDLFKSGETSRESYKELWETILSGKEWQGEFHNKKKNGDLYWEAATISPIMDAEGKITHFLAIKEDITRRKKDEQRVNERTLQLQTANKELEAFAYSVSHDLRAPLRSIDGWSMALLEDCYDQLDKQGKEYLDRVRSESQRMGFLIDDLLKLSRVSRTEIKKVNVDLTSLAKDITKRLIKTPTDRRFEIIIQPGMFTMGDQSMLDIALTNLLDNAYKFTSRQQIARIEFGQSVIADKQTYWVKDNGVGFDMSYSKNLFGAFQRMHKQSDFPGTGIGLATVQRIIHRHDGEIWVESKKDQGTTFYFTITDETR